MPNAEHVPSYTTSTLLHWLIDHAADLDRRGRDRARDPVHERRLRSLARGLGITLDESLVRRGLGRISPRGVRLSSWLRLREASHRFMHPASGVLEGDPWGTSDVEGDARRTVEAALESHERLAAQVRRNLDTIDRALCALLDWDPDASVAIDALEDFPPFVFRPWTADDF